MELALADAKQPTAVRVQLADDSIDTTFDVTDGWLRLSFKQPTVLQSGQRLDVHVKVL